MIAADPQINLRICGIFYFFGNLLVQDKQV
jgi:hypothetical protein